MSDRHAIFMRTLAGLVPWNEAASDALRGLALGAKVKAEVKRPRNPGHHDKYWALCSKIADAIPGEYTAENISDVLKIKAGHSTAVQTKDGVIFLPKSIAWSKMDQPAFAKFYERCLVVICEQWLPHLKPSDLVREIEGMVAA
jgi:hypothetical protein